MENSLGLRTIGFSMVKIRLQFSRRTYFFPKRHFSISQELNKYFTFFYVIKLLVNVHMEGKKFQLMFSAKTGHKEKKKNGKYYFQALVDREKNSVWWRTKITNKPAKKISLGSGSLQTFTKLFTKLFEVRDDLVTTTYKITLSKKSELTESFNFVYWRNRLFSYSAKFVFAQKKTPRRKKHDSNW